MIDELIYAVLIAAIIYLVVQILKPQPEFKPVPIPPKLEPRDYTEEELLEFNGILYIHLSLALL